MTEIVNLSLTDFKVFFLLLARMSGLFSFAPLLGTHSIPVMVKVGFAVLLSIILFPHVNNTAIALPSSLWQFWYLIFKELAVGLCLGFAANFVFEGIRLAGQLIAFQMNLSMADMIDPLLGAPTTAIEQLKIILASLIFLIINGHHWLIKAFTYSYDLVPLTQAVFSGAFINKLVLMSSGIFVIAFKVSAPVFVTLFIMTVIIGIIERMIPQMHMFAVGFPLKIGVGLIMLVAFLNIFIVVFHKVFAGLNGNLDILLKSLNG